MEVDGAAPPIERMTAAVPVYVVGADAPAGADVIASPRRSAAVPVNVATCASGAAVVASLVRNRAAVPVNARGSSVGVVEPPAGRATAAVPVVADRGAT